MGTGITSIILHSFQYQFKGVTVLATIVFALNATLFFAFLGVSIALYIIWPSVFSLMLNHSVQSLFLGTFAMGMATVGNGIVLIMVPAFGETWIYIAWGWWFANSFISVLIGIGVPFLMFTRHKNNAVSSVTGVWLLPVVGPIVAAAAGGIVAGVLPPDYARLTVFISYLMLGSGLLPALLVMALYFQRLAIYKVPPPEVLVSVLLPVGPCGQSAFAILQLASVLRKVGLGGTYFDAVEQKMMVSAISGLSIIVALFLLGLGFFWLILAIATILDLVAKARLPFNMGWWGFTFPVGTMATAMILLSKQLDSSACRVVAAILSVAVIFLWLFIAARTAFAAVLGDIFIAPCLGASGQPPCKDKSSPTVAEQKENV